MSDRELLEAKGYVVGTRDLAVHWLCNLEWQDNVKSFFGATEREAVAVAAQYVEELEASYQEQQRRLVCEGCGE